MPLAAGGTGMEIYKKKALSVSKVRQILEPGPIVLVSSAWKGKRNIMTMGWHTVMEFTPSLVGCVIASSNHSFSMIRKSGECVLNVPTADMADIVVGIGNCSGEKFGLTPAPGKKVKAPAVRECFANLECVLHDTRMINRYNFFIFEVVRAQTAVGPEFPKTLHYHGRGLFTTDGRLIDRREKFTKWKDTPIF
jgi:flavin reductase (DIM6/NTAB) family NADH-FMN oxidoreductase RutF